jgi:tRNA U34 5-methylaminomethyl-2-thiouridine-forming methyltransferase MnmC
MTELQTALTEDGTVTCVDPETGELYHNRAGAYLEALKNYTEPSGAIERLQHTGELRLLDVCFGLGYNTWVLLETLLQNPPTGFSIQVTAVEQDKKMVAIFPRVLSDPRFLHLKSIWPALEHNIYYQTQPGDADFTIDVADRGRIRFDFRWGDLRKIVPTLEGDFDTVFHDPFSPNKVPELWTADLFREYHRLLTRRSGALLTYSAAGAVRGGLREAGFHLYRTVGVGRKSGGTLAAIEPVAAQNTPQWGQTVFSLTAEEEAYLRKRSGIPYRDVDFNQERRLIFRRREEEQQAMPS